MSLDLKFEGGHIIKDGMGQWGGRSTRKLRLLSLGRPSANRKQIQWLTSVLRFCLEFEAVSLKCTSLGSCPSVLVKRRRRDACHAHKVLFAGELVF